MLECQEFRYYARGSLSGAPFACHCSAWSVSCPFETCGARRAWEDDCLSEEARVLGFKELSKDTIPLDPKSLPQPMTGFKTYPGIISMCMYWLPKPPTLRLPAINLPDFLHGYANIKLRGADALDCLRLSARVPAVFQTRAALATVLGLEVVTVNCGDGGFNALLKGTPAQLQAGVAKATQPSFCFDAPAVPVHFCMAPPLQSPGPAPALSPGPAPAPAPAPGSPAPGPAPEAL